MKKLITLNFNGFIDENEKLKYRLRQFPCGEFEFSIQEKIDDFDIEIYQTFTTGNFNNELMELQIVCDVLRRNSVKSITYVSPFLPYTRQDRTFNLTGSLGAKIVAEIVNNCGIGKIITYDFHALQIEGFFKGQVHNLSAVPLFLKDIESKFDKKDIVIVFPDAGSASRFKRFFDNTDYEIAIIQKVRNDDGIAMKILGNASGKTAIILDDMIDSGGTIIEASNVLKKQNAKDIFVYATHGVLSGNAVQNLQNENNISQITITNSLQQNCLLSEKFEVIELIEDKNV